MGDLLDKLPVKGEVWRHTKTGGTYQIVGSVYNAITDAIDVEYVPLYPFDYARFTRQIVGHPKAWITPNKDGTPRYVKVEGRVAMQAKTDGDA